MSPETRFTRTTGIETAPLQQDSILYHPTINRFCILNRTSSLMWERLQQPATAQQLAAEVTAKFAGITEPEALKDVEATLAKLLELELVVAHES